MAPQALRSSWSGRTWNFAGHQTIQSPTMTCPLARTRLRVWYQPQRRCDVARELGTLVWTVLPKPQPTSFRRPLRGEAMTGRCNAMTLVRRHGNLGLTACQRPHATTDHIPSASCCITTSTRLLLASSVTSTVCGEPPFGDIPSSLMRNCIPPPPRMHWTKKTSSTVAPLTPRSIALGRNDGWAHSVFTTVWRRPCTSDCMIRPHCCRGHLSP